MAHSAASYSAKKYAHAEMTRSESRWALPDLQSVVDLCALRNSQKIRCIIDVLGEYARTEQQAVRSVEAYLSVANAISEYRLEASLSVKLSALGVLFDRDGCSENVKKIAEDAGRRKIGFEIDMEGQGFVTFAVDTAIQCARTKQQVSLALQAYLDRTCDDLKRVERSEITVRVVKGAYVGSTADFVEIQQRFKKLVRALRTHSVFFSVGTHDPELIEWIKTQTEANRDLVEFGFLRGLADRTKLALAKEGWRVSEYVPFGETRAAYESRRQKYLNELQKLGRKPAP
jgi:proline dehydrogenase